MRACRRGWRGGRNVRVRLGVAMDVRRRRRVPGGNMNGGVCFLAESLPAFCVAGLRGVAVFKLLPPVEPVMSSFPLT